MDLHDYQDVAENYDAYLDVMYREHDSYEGFLDFYLDLARRSGGGGVLAERIRPLKMRQTYVQELLYLFELCGLEVVDRFGDYRGSRADTGRYVWVLRKARG